MDEGGSSKNLFLVIPLSIILILSMFIFIYTEFFGLVEPTKVLNYTYSIANDHLSISKDQRFAQTFNSTGDFNLTKLAIKLCRGASYLDPTYFINVSIYSTNSSGLPFFPLFVNNTINLTNATSCLVRNGGGDWFNISFPKIVLKNNTRYAFVITNMHELGLAFGLAINNVNYAEKYENLSLTGYSGGELYSIDVNKSNNYFESGWKCSNNDCPKFDVLFEIWGYENN